jgi:putative toxin-antitoxin system antitoxin component (TIGR02293 family)
MAGQIKHKKALKLPTKGEGAISRSRTVSKVTSLKVESAKTAGSHKKPLSSSKKGSAVPTTVFSYNSVDDKNILAIIDAVRTGISVSEFENVTRNIPFSVAEWATYLQLSERTIQRAQKDKKSFQPIHSERIVELVMLYEYGMEVFGDKENFDIWLNSKSISLGGRTPKELFDTRFGVNMVKDELGRIEHGVLA